MTTPQDFSSTSNLRWQETATNILRLRGSAGLVVEVGRSDEFQRVGAGKRLSENIYLRTFLERETITEDLTFSTMLEWAINYW